MYDLLTFNYEKGRQINLLVLLHIVAFSWVKQVNEKTAVITAIFNTDVFLTFQNFSQEVLECKNLKVILIMEYD
jgi:hypothetical protein